MKLARRGLRPLATVGAVLCALSATLRASAQQQPAEQKQPSAESKAAADRELLPADFELSIEIPVTDPMAVPETVRVQYKNKSATRGFIELPGPVRGHQFKAYRTPALAIDSEAEGKDELLLGRGGFFLYAPTDDKQPERRSVAVLNPGESVTIPYSLSDFCMIGHGIAPNAEANFRACYSPGKLKTKVRAAYITVWEPEISMKESTSVVLELSAADYNKVPAFRGEGRREREPQQ